MRQLVFFFLLLIPFTSLAAPLVWVGPNCTFPCDHGSPVVGTAEQIADCAAIVGRGV